MYDGSERRIKRENSGVSVPTILSDSEQWLVRLRPGSVKTGGVIEFLRRERAPESFTATVKFPPREQPLGWYACPTRMCASDTPANVASIATMPTSDGFSVRVSGADASIAVAYRTRLAA